MVVKIKALTLVFILVFSSTLFVNFAEANWLIPSSPSPPKCEVSILLPELNGRYGSNIGVDFMVMGYDWASLTHTLELSSISYSLDDKPAVPFVGEQILLPNSHGYYYDNLNMDFHFLVNLTGLSDGVHSLMVNVEYKGTYSPEPYKMADFKASGSSPKTNFTVNIKEDNKLPEISILSPKNQTYNTYDIPITFTVSEPYSQIKYIFDGKNAAQLIQTQL